MRLRHFFRAGLASIVLLCGSLGSSALCAQGADNPGFKALPRSINYNTPLAPVGGTKAIIVYGKQSAYTQACAQAVQKAVEEWSGVRLELLEDRTVTSDDTWLLKQEYRKTPIIVVGNAKDNRLMHALGTRYLLQSNRTWPGGDRYVIRTVFEPFAADVNYITLEASAQAGLEGAVAKLADTLKALPKGSATIPLTRVTGCGKDQWRPDDYVWQVPKEYQAPSGSSAAKIAADFKGKPAIADGNLRYGDPWSYIRGGRMGMPQPGLVEFSTDKLRASAAVLLNGGRAIGGRTHLHGDHYSCVGLFLGMRSVIEAGILGEKEVNELENFMMLSITKPEEGWYDSIASDDGFINSIGCRHSAALTTYSILVLDYLRNHCRMDDNTRKEIERRADGARRTVSRFAGGFRDNVDDWELGETTLMWFNAMVHQGILDPIRSGRLRLMADAFEMTTDNLPDAANVMPGRYAGLDCYIGAQPGAITGTWHGRGLIPAAAFYYDDPQYRWLARQGTGNMEGPHNSVAAPMFPMHWDTAGELKEPAIYTGVRALPFDGRLYDIAVRQAAGQDTRWNPHPLKVPGPRERCVDRIAFRDGMRPDDAYMFFATSQRTNGDYSLPLHNNALARYTDLGELWLFHNCMKNTGWTRNVVSISNGRPYQPQFGCTLEALANVGEFSIASARENEVSGAAWTRSVVHWRGHYFAVLDRVEALADDEFNLICRWRSLQPAGLDGRIWRACAPSGSYMTIQGTDSIPQTSEFWDADGAARPYVLSQYRQAKLAKGQAQTFQNLISVAGPSRPDEFSVRRAWGNAMMVKGKTAAGEHIALIGTGGDRPSLWFETDAAVFVVEGSRLHLAGATNLKVKVGQDRKEVLLTERPVNVLLDCEKKKVEIDVLGENAVATKVAGVSAAPKGRANFDLPSDLALPRPEPLLSKLWDTLKDPKDAAAVETEPVKAVFDCIEASQALSMDRRKLSPVTISSTPPSRQPIHSLSDGECCAALPMNVPTWTDTDRLEIKLQLPKREELSHLRLVGITKNGLDFKTFGQMWNEKDDFKFSLVLSDDDFKSDNRVIESPKVSFEETSIYPVVHYALGRLPTWRIEVGAKARAIKVLPRATKKEKPELCLTEIEAYGADPAASMNARAFAADIDGDGGNELIVGTSNKEVAAFDAQGKRLWRNTYAGEIFTMDCADLDEDGKTEALVYTTDEKLHRINGDGTERPVTDIWKAQVDKWGYPGCGGMITLGAWGPDDVKKKEVVMFSEGFFRVLPDGKAVNFISAQARGAARVPNLYPGESEVLATIHTSVDLWSSKRNAEGNYTHLGRGLQTAGPSSAICMRGFGWIRPVNLPKFKGVLAANEGGLNYFPMEAFQENSKVTGWGMTTGGAAVTAALAQDVDGDGVPEVFLGRQDGFVNVLSLEDGKPKALLNAGGPVLGVAVLKDASGQPCLAVGAKFGVFLFDRNLGITGMHRMKLAAFAGPAGKQMNCMYAIGSDGQVRILTLR